MITTSANGARSVYATDLDGDGDADVLSASSGDDKIAWYENQGGGVFGAQQVITTSADGAVSVYSTDLDGDGDADVLSASFFDDKIAWYQNLNSRIYSDVSCSVTNHSGGYPAELVALGTQHVSYNSFALKVSQLPATGTTAYLFNAFLSPQQTLSVVSNPSIGGVASSGNVCIAGGTFGRHVFGGDIFMGTDGFFEIPVDLTAVPSPRDGVSFPNPGHYSTTVLAGETWYWQCWFRDAQEGAGHSNFSNAISVTFQ
ncbi:MAG: VCBS repeat-containing protein [Proteobacteria bacterium]|nr:VCBS repeat-containing protein [Pseudomonadota bacterium]